MSKRNPAAVSDHTSSTNSIHSPTKSKEHLPLTSPSQNMSKKVSDRSTTNCPSSKLEEVKRLHETSPYNQSVSTAPYNQSVDNLTIKKQRRVQRAHRRRMTYPQSKAKTQNSREEWNDSTKCEDSDAHVHRNKATHTRTNSNPSHPHGKLKYDDPLFEKVRHAKQIAESAIKVCTCGQLTPVLCEVPDDLWLMT